MAPKMSSAFEEMSKAECDVSAVPVTVKSFLKKHLDVYRYEEHKKVYLMLHTKKPNDFLKHLVQSYALIHFWKHMFVYLVENTMGSIEPSQTGLEKFVEKMVYRTGTPSH